MAQTAQMAQGLTATQRSADPRARKGKTPTAAFAATKLAERAARAAEIVAELEADPELGRLIDSTQTPEGDWHVTYRGSDGRSEYDVYIDPENAANDVCTCPDHWGRTWCGACKHTIAFRVLFLRLGMQQLKWAEADGAERSRAAA